MFSKQKSQATNIDSLKNDQRLLQKIEQIKEFTGIQYNCVLLDLAKSYTDVQIAVEKYFNHSWHKKWKLNPQQELPAKLAECATMQDYEELVFSTMRKNNQNNYEDKISQTQNQNQSINNWNINTNFKQKNMKSSISHSPEEIFIIDSDSNDESLNENENENGTKWKKRFMGSFETTAWYTRSGTDLLKYNENVALRIDIKDGKNDIKWITNDLLSDKNDLNPFRNNSKIRNQIENDTVDIKNDTKRIMNDNNNNNNTENGKTATKRLKTLNSYSKLDTKNEKPDLNNIKNAKRLKSSSPSFIIRIISNKTNSEVARLNSDFCLILGPLILNNSFQFLPKILYTPQPARTGASILLQIRCFVLRNAFYPQSIPYNNEYQLKAYSNALCGIIPLLKLKPFSQPESLLHSQIDNVKTLQSPIEQNIQPDPIKKLDGLKSIKNSKSNNGNVNGILETKQNENENEEENITQDTLNALYEKSQQYDIDMPMADNPKDFNVSLFSYQRQGLWWMMNKEKAFGEDNLELKKMHPLWQAYHFPDNKKNSNSSTEQLENVFYLNPYQAELSLSFPHSYASGMGGIIADEMGLGKTISTLSLISQNMYTRKDDSEDKDNYFAKYTTLIVAPMSLLSQWQSEVKKASKKLRSLVYYGADRERENCTVSLRELLCGTNANNDAPHVLITSYGVIMSEYNIVQKESMQKNKGLFNIRFFRVVLDEAHIIKNPATKTSKACYAIQADRRWCVTGTPIVNKLDDLYSLLRFLKFDPWCEYKYWKTFVTIPYLQNKIFKALEVVQAILEPIILRRKKNMKDKEGNYLVKLPPKSVSVCKVQLSPNEKEVYKYFYDIAERTFKSAMENGTVTKNYTNILTDILRLRQICCHPSLVEETEEFLNSGLLKCNDECDSTVPGEQTLKSFISFHKNISEEVYLKEMVSYLLNNNKSQKENIYELEGIKEANEKREDESDISKDSEEEGYECPICTTEEIIQPAIISPCCHIACKGCILGMIKYQEEHGQKLMQCPVCRTEIKSQENIYEVLYPSDSKVERTENNVLIRKYERHTSSKVEALLGALRDIRATDPSIKSVVFSQFTGFLNIIGKALAKDGFPVLRIDGTMDQKSRKQTLYDFEHYGDTNSMKKEIFIENVDVLAETEDQNKQKINAKPILDSDKITFGKESKGGMILLVSLKAGGTGLNLTSASRIFLMDPWWAYATEAQAIDRVHRMGQKSAVFATRFIVEDSIEEKMLEAQERKNFLAMASGGTSGNDEQRNARLEDLQELFRNRIYK